MRIIAVVFLGLLASGCATVTRGTTEQIQFVSEPSGAAVRTSMGHTCVAPCTLPFSRKDEFITTFSMPGYVDQQIPVGTRVAGSGAVGFAGNVLIGGVIGMGVDVATGSALEHFPNPVSAIMEPVAIAPSPRGPPAARRPPPTRQPPPPSS
jgi:hypothetical protein